MDLLDGFIRQLETATHLLRSVAGPLPVIENNKDRFGIDRMLRTYIRNRTLSGRLLIQ